MKKDIKLIIFDLDGTLVDAYQAVAESINKALAYFGYPRLDKKTIQMKVGWGERNLIKAFVKKEDIDKVQSIYRQNNKAALKSGVKFMPWAKELILEIKKRKYTLALATNRPVYSTQVILKHLKIGRYFDFIVCGDDVKRMKPDPEILNTILKQFSRKPREAIFIGDMTVDIETGNNAGVKTICVVTGSSEEKDILALKPFRVIYRLNEVIDILGHSR